jgi:hypothetical protein
MPWEACPVMEERLRFAPGRERASGVTRKSGISRKTDIRFSIPARSTASKPSPIALGVRCAAPINRRSRSKRFSSAEVQGKRGSAQK